MRRRRGRARSILLDQRAIGTNDHGLHLARRNSDILVILLLRQEARISRIGTIGRGRIRLAVTVDRQGVGHERLLDDIHRLFVAGDQLLLLGCFRRSAGDTVVDGLVLVRHRLAARVSGTTLIGSLSAAITTGSPLPTILETPPPRSA